MNGVANNVSVILRCENVVFRASFRLFTFSVCTGSAYMHPMHTTCIANNLSMMRHSNNDDDEVEDIDNDKN